MHLRHTCTLLLLAGSLVTVRSQTPVDLANARSLALVGKSSPAFTLPDFGQKTFALADRRGQIVVLAFWATWCPPCRSEMPTLAKLQRELAPQGVSLVPVAFDNPAKALDFLAKKKIDVWSLIDEDGKVASLYGARALPRTFLIDRNGVVVRTWIVKVSESELRSAIAAAQR